MFKLYNFQNNNKTEIIPENGIYNVDELGEYEFEYNGTLINNDIYLEDIPIDYNYYHVYENNIKSQRYRFFQDFFGYSTLIINNECLHLNIRIEKFKLNEVEDIFIYLWEKDEKLFNVFISKSTFSIDFNNKNVKYETSSKFINLLEKFYTVFESLLPYFKKNPHTVLRSDFKIIDYSPQSVTPHSIEWILNNLDCLSVDFNLNTNPNAIKLNNNYALIDKIETEYKINTLKIYENEIILGVFLNVLYKISLFEIEINQYIDKSKDNIDNKYSDIKDLKKIPFLKLKERIKIIEPKIKKLYQNYKSFFKEVLPRFEKPVLTAVFSNSFHYKKAYLFIQQIWNSKYNLFGEYHLMNIRKLSQLYEIYNLFSIIDALKNRLKSDTYSISVSSTREDDIINKISFSNSETQINLYYEQKYFSYNKKDSTKLRRIDNSKGTYYMPDYIIEFINKSRTNYYIFDSKYSKLETIKNSFLNNILFKYILNTGIEGELYKKIEILCLLYPGDKSENIINSNIFKPIIKIIASKPNKEDDLIKLIDEIIKNEKKKKKN